jgi:hypothetical protein
VIWQQSWRLRVARQRMLASAANPASLTVPLPCRFRAVTPWRLLSASNPLSRKGIWRHPSRDSDLREVCTLTRGLRGILPS